MAPAITDTLLSASCGILIKDETEGFMFTRRELKLPVENCMESSLHAEERPS